MRVKLGPSLPLRGTLRLPGDKSISHRALFLGALAEGATTLENLADGEDVKSTAACLRALGVSIATQTDLTIVQGTGGSGFKSPNATLDCGNSGTTLRLLLGLLAGLPICAVLDGDDSLRRRPMRRVVEPLQKMGASFTLTNEQQPPIEVRGATLRAIDYELPVASAQVKSALLLAGLFADGVTRLGGLIDSRDHTERLLPHFGVELLKSNDVLALRGGQVLRATRLAIPGDASSAAVWAVAASIVAGSRVQLSGVSLNPTRLGAVRVLLRMGARINWQLRVERPEPLGELRIESAPLIATAIDAAEVPALIDELPVLAVAAACATGVTMVRGAAELRVKESNRIAAIVSSLQAFGVVAEELPDGFRVVGQGEKALRRADASSFADHRMAMTLALAALRADGESTLDGAESVAVSYPAFWQDLRKLGAAPRLEKDA